MRFITIRHCLILYCSIIVPLNPSLPYFPARSLALQHRGVHVLSLFLHAPVLQHRGVHVLAIFLHAPVLGALAGE